MTNREIKLELAKAAFASTRHMTSETLSQSIKNLYEWILEEEEADVDVKKTDYDKTPVAEVIKYVETNDLGHCGYGIRIQNILHANNITTVGDLLREGRINFLRFRDVGRGSITRIDDALYELYGIKGW